MSDAFEQYAGDSPLDAVAEAIRPLALPFALVDIDSLTVLAASQATAELIAEPTALVGRSWLDFVPAADRENASQLMGLLRSGKLRRFVSFASSFGPRATQMTFWGSVLEFGDKRFVLGWALAGAADQPSPLARYLGREPVEMAVGTVDSEWRIRTISREGARLLGIPADAIVGERLVAAMPQLDARRLLEAGARVDAAQSAALQVRWDHDDESQDFTCFLARPAGIDDLVFMLVHETAAPATNTGSRTAELERHLVNIAAEVEASGVLHRFFALPDPAHVPELQRLSVRQWEIMSRLLNGDRVPTISRELYVSQSTVRNQLSAIFRRFGVHSQAELLALLGTRRSGGAPPGPMA